MPRQKKITPLSNSPRITSTLAEWTARHANQDLLRFIVCGGAADGKSTLIDRLLWESEQVLDGELSAQAADSIHRGSISNDINFALLEDSLIKERKQLITTGVTYRFFSSPRRKFIAADMPTQAQYASNLVSAASTADVALLLIDAHQGVVMQTHSLAYLISLAGIRHIILVLNKMDLVGYDGQVFDAIVVQFRALAQTLGLASITAVPVSALKGGNITTHSAHMPWYQGPTLMSGLDSIDVNPQLMYKAAFPVQWINRPNASFKGFGGTLASGELAVGDEVRVTASGQVAKVKRIVTADADLQKARAGDAITLVLDRDVDAGRGDVLAKADQPLEITDQFEATLVWMQDEPGLMGRAYEIKLANQWASASITALKYRVDVNTLGHESCRQLELNDIAVANLALSKPLVFDAYADCRTLGGFILVDKFSHATVAAGMVRHNLRRAQNVHRQALSITRQDRERLNGHHGKVIWFTGLSGSGKYPETHNLVFDTQPQWLAFYNPGGTCWPWVRQGQR